MEGELAAASKEALVEIVKLAQKRGMKGSKGNWKEFLAVYDTKFGSSLSDPAKRQADVLLAFIKTFNEQEEDMKFLNKVMQCRSNPDAIIQFGNAHPDAESPEMKLVRLTVGHPHYALDYSFPSHEEGWSVTKLIKGKKKHPAISMYAVDCEMVLCEDGTEALAKICVVDRSQAIKLHEFVKPDKEVVDYRSEITGLTAKDLNGARSSLADVQKSLTKLISYGTILVGHGLNNDLKVLKLDHARVIDTSLIFKYGVEGSFKRPSLYNLCKAVLGYELRKTGAPHNCLDDATAAMKLVLSKIQSGDDNVLPIPSEPASEIDMSKLLLHRVPSILPTKKLHKIIPGDFTIQSKPKRNGQADYYSALAIFKNQEEADKAFECTHGNADKDSYGRPQKHVSYKLKNGVSGELYVRKMSVGSSEGQVVPSRKRALDSKDNNPNELKIPKTDKLGGGSQCTTVEDSSDECKIHLKEIERLNKQLKERENEISSLNKIIVALTRKQGL